MRFRHERLRCQENLPARSDSPARPTAIDRDAGQAALGYIVATAARGRGVARRTLGLLTDGAFREARIERALVIIAVDDLAFQRVAARCGYQLEGVMRSIHLKPGRWIDAGLWVALGD